MSWRAVFAASGLLTSVIACSYYTAESKDGGDAGASGGSSGTVGSSSASGGSTSGGSSSSGGSSASGGSSSSGGSSASSSSGGVVVTQYEQELLDLLNAARASADPTPSPALPVLFWDPVAAASTLTWTSGCDTEANAPAGMIHGSGSSPLPASLLVGLLTNRKSAYDRDTNTCSAGVSACNVYKMVVKRSVVKVGCSVTTCGSDDLWACVFTDVGTITDPPY